MLWLQDYSLPCHLTAAGARLTITSYTAQQHVVVRTHTAPQLPTSAGGGSGWRFDGWLCEALSVDTGLMWECPLLCPLEFVRESAFSRALSSLQPIVEAERGSPDPSPSSSPQDESLLGGHAAGAPGWDTHP